MEKTPITIFSTLIISKIEKKSLFAYYKSCILVHLASLADSVPLQLTSRDGAYEYLLSPGKRNTFNNGTIELSNIEGLPPSTKKANKVGTNKSPPESFIILENITECSSLVPIIAPDLTKVCLISS